MLQCTGCAYFSSITSQRCCKERRSSYLFRRAASVPAGQMPAGDKDTLFSGVKHENL